MSSLLQWVILALYSTRWSFEVIANFKSILTSTTKLFERYENDTTAASLNFFWLEIKYFCFKSSNEFPRGRGGKKLHVKMSIKSNVAN